MNLINIQNKEGKVKLTELVTPESVERVIDDITKIYGKAAVGNYMVGQVVASEDNALDTLEIEIHSSGGSVFDGYRIFNSILELRDRGVYVTAKINTRAASMASVIAMAADKITINHAGELMIHEASMGLQGDADDFAKASEMLETISDNIANIYASRTGLSKNTVRDLMKEETYMTAEKALSLNFVDEIFGKQKDKPNNTNIFDTVTNLMSIFDKFKPDAALVEKVTGLEAELRTTENSLAELVTSFDERGTALQNAVTELTQLKETFRVTNEELTKAKEAADENAQKITNLTNELELAKKSAHNRAVDILAQAGHSVVDTTDISDTKALTREAINAISDPVERSKARLKNWNKLNK